MTGVVYVDARGNEQRQKARAVCVACNAIETARLLLNSASALFPDGLANSGGQVGRNYMRHVTGAVFATFDKPVRMYRGETMAGIVTDESRNDPGRGFVGGYYMQLHSLGPSFLANFLSPRAWGRDFAKIMEQYDHMAGMLLVGEDLPQERNRVTLNRDVHDQFGQPVPDVHVDEHPNDVAMREHGYAAGESVYGAVDATATFRVPPYPASHNLGTARMSARPGGRRRERVRACARRAEPVRVRWQRDDDRGGGEPDADDRRAGAAPGRPHRAAAESGGALTGLHSRAVIDVIPGA